MLKSVLASVLASLAVAAPAQWTQVAPGIEYQKFTLSDPNDVYVARMTRAETTATIDAMLGQGKLDDATRQTVSGMANLYDGSIGYWGQEWGKYTYDVAIAINGDFWDTTLNMPQNGQIQTGWYAKRFTDVTGGSGFAWTLNRDAFIGQCVSHIASKNKVAYPATSQDQNINAINLPRGADQFVIYTPQFDATTGTDNSGIEVIVQLGRPAMILPTPSYAAGTVVEVRDGLGNSKIPFDHVVLSATGSAATKLRTNTSVGAQIHISQEITHYQGDCSTGGAPDWSKTYASIGSSFDFLRSGVIDPHSHDSGATTRAPRTAIALNDDYIFFFVVDGRRPGSAGMTMQELGEFAKNTLGAVDGVNQDGGGSSAMWVNGSIVNVPSDGTERATYNGLMMVSLVPKTTSNALGTGYTVQTLSSVPLRQGPGSNFLTLSTASSGATGTVVEHDLNGIWAKGDNWWLIDVAGNEGWAPQSALQSLTAAGDVWKLY